MNWINRYYFCELKEIGTKSDTDRYAFPKLGIYLHMFLFSSHANVQRVQQSLINVA